MRKKQQQRMFTQHRLQESWLDGGKVKSLVDDFLIEINNNLEKYPKMNIKDVIEILAIIRNNINNLEV